MHYAALETTTKYPSTSYPTFSLPDFPIYNNLEIDKTSSELHMAWSDMRSVILHHAHFLLICLLLSYLFGLCIKLIFGGDILFSVFLIAKRAFAHQRTITAYHSHLVFATPHALQSIRSLREAPPSDGKERIRECDL